MTYGITLEPLTLPFRPGELSWNALDVDKTGNWLAVIEAKPGLRIVTPWSDIALPFDLRFARARWLDDKALVWCSRIEKAGDINAWIIDPVGGRVHKSFSIGDGVRDVLVLKDYVAVSYFDEGIFSFESPSQEGLAIFTHEGEYLWGYMGAITDAVTIDDCYAMSRIGPNHLTFCAYSDFMLVDLDVGQQTHIVRETPAIIQGCGAITRLDATTFFRGPYPADALPVRVVRDDVFAFDHNKGSVELVGKLPGNHAQGLLNGRMLCLDDKGVAIASFTPYPD